MYRLLPLLGDAGLGILSIIFVSFCYGRSDMSGFLLLPLAFLPDLDAIPELWKEGKVSASAKNPHDHRELLHKPIIWLLILGMWWYLGGFYGAVAFALVAGHFIHDSILTGWGVPWLSPFSNVRIKFFANERNEESFARKDWIRVWSRDDLHILIIKYGNDNWIEDLYLRPTAVSVIEYSFFAVSLFALLGFLLA